MNVIFFGYSVQIGSEVSSLEAISFSHSYCFYMFVCYLFLLFPYFTSFHKGSRQASKASEK